MKFIVSIKRLTSRLPFAVAYVVVTMLFGTCGLVAVCVGQEQELLGISGGALISIDLENESIEEIGPTGFSVLSGLAFDATNRTLFSIDVLGNQLVAIDPSTGLGNAVGTIGFDGVVGLVFSSASNTLFSVDTDVTTTDPLISVDPNTGEGESIGSTGFNGIGGLAFDTSTATLFGVGSPQGSFREELVSIDEQSGSAAFVAPVNSIDADALTFDSLNFTLIGASNGFSDPLFGNAPTTIFSLNQSNGDISLIASFPFPQTFGGLAFVTAAIPEPGTGCVLMLGLTGSLLRRRR